MEDYSARGAIGLLKPDSVYKSSLNVHTKYDELKEKLNIILNIAIRNTAFPFLITVS